MGSLDGIDTSLIDPRQRTFSPTPACTRYVRLSHTVCGTFRIGVALGSANARQAVHITRGNLYINRSFLDALP